MKMENISLKKVEEAIQKFPPEDQAQLLKDLPKLIALHPLDLARLRLAEPAFDFWNNPEDTDYDHL